MSSRTIASESEGLASHSMKPYPAVLEKVIEILLRCADAAQLPGAVRFAVFTPKPRQCISAGCDCREATRPFFLRRWAQCQSNDRILPLYLKARDPLSSSTRCQRVGKARDSLAGLLRGTLRSRHGIHQPNYCGHRKVSMQYHVPCLRILLLGISVACDLQRSDNGGDAWRRLDGQASPHC